MKFKALRSLLILSLALILVVGGTTIAWFTAEFEIPSAAEMLVGTLAFEIKDASVYASADDGLIQEAGEIMDWGADECKEFHWTFENTGSKRSFFRARPEAEFTGLGSSIQKESAWGEGTRFSKQGNWSMYFTHGKDGSTTTKLLAGQNIDIGTVEVWEEGSNLYVRYTTQDGWYMTKTHLAVAPDVKTILGEKDKNPPPGQFQYKNTHNLVQSYTHVIPLPDYDPVYLAAHADVEKRAEASADIQITWSLPAGSPWAVGRFPDGRPDGWYYYCGPVASEGQVTLVLKGCLDDDAGNGSCTVTLEAEAVQVTHGAADEEWNGSPCSQ